MSRGFVLFFCATLGAKAFSILPLSQGPAENAARVIEAVFVSKEIVSFKGAAFRRFNLKITSTHRGNVSLTNIHFKFMQGAERLFPSLTGLKPGNALLIFCEGIHSDGRVLIRDPRLLIPINSEVLRNPFTGKIQSISGFLDTVRPPGRPKIKLPKE